VTASQFFLDPLRGKTTLWRVCWLYSIVGGAILQALAWAVAGRSVAAARTFALFALAYSIYVTISIYRCAGNCPWPTFGRVVRLCALVGLLVTPYMGYLLFNGAAVAAP
jgi:hypothetical protein